MFNAIKSCVQINDCCNWMGIGFALDHKKVDMLLSILTFLKYLMPEPSFEKNNKVCGGAVVMLFNSRLGAYDGSYFSQRYWSKSENNSLAEIRSCLLRCHCPAH